MEEDVVDESCVVAVGDGGDAAAAAAVVDGTEVAVEALADVAAKEPQHEDAGSVAGSHRATEQPLRHSFSLVPLPVLSYTT